MKGSIIAGSLALASAVSASVQHEHHHKEAHKRQSSGSLTPITVSGNSFMQGNQRFFIRGVDYQPGGSSMAADPLADSNGCSRDIPYFQQLGINTIRVYTVDNTANHDDCMNALAQAGIYVVLDVNTPKYSINRNDPFGSYNDVYLQSIFSTVDAFKNYPNTMAFFSGNEVINAVNNTDAAPYIKAVTRDLKAYVKAQSPRIIPVGYSAADVQSNRVQTAYYLNCGPDSDAADMFAFNDYSWCDPSSYTTSGWDQRVAEYSNYSIPIFFSEFGCITNTRTFQEIQTLYTPPMAPIFSGGLVYQYTEEGAGYGLVNLQGSSVNPKPDFTALQSQYSQNPAPTNVPGAIPSGTRSTCPTADANWQPGFPNNMLPAMPVPAQQFLKNGAGPGPGLTGPGSQDTGTASSSNVTIGASSGTGSSSSSSSSSAAAVTMPPAQSLLPILMGSFVVGLTFAGGLLL